RRDHVAEAPAQFTEVARVESLDRGRIVRPAAPHHPLVPRLRRGVDGDDGQACPECLAEDFQFGSSTKSVDEHPLSRDARERPFTRPTTASLPPCGPSRAAIT